MEVAAYSPSFGFEKNEAECEKICELINQSGATVLGIGVGAPKQEKWICKYKDRLPNIKVFLAIGATIDFEAGYRARSPQWMSQVGIEWLHRLLSEPNRLWKRYLIEGLPFFWLIFQQKLHFYKTPFASSCESEASDWVSFSTSNLELEQTCRAIKLQLTQQQLGNSKPIGQILQEAGLLSATQVQAILQEQTDKHTSLRFGDILTQRGWLKRETVDFMVEELPLLPTQKEKQPLGQYLKSAALLDDEQITLLLVEQQQTGKRFGEMAVLKGWVKKETVNLFLKYLAALSEADRTLK